jgi:alpha-glucosidase (family GH31 glycosyl hydrolase)
MPLTYCKSFPLALVLLALGTTAHAATLVSGGLEIRAAVDQADVFRFEVARAAAGATSDASPLVAGDAALSFEGESVVIRRGATIVWRGTLRTLDDFGRARVPGIEIAWNAHPDEKIYGLGERFDQFNQAGKRVDLWIEDAPGQGDRSTRTYYAAPVAYSSAGYALFTSDNPESVFDLNSGGDGVNRVQRAGENVTFYVAVAGSLVDLIDRRTAIQGRPRNVPAWTFGPWISRNSYETQAEAEEAIRGHLDRGNPVAAIVQEAWKGSSETGDFNNFSKDAGPKSNRFSRCAGSTAFTTCSGRCRSFTRRARSSRKARRKAISSRSRTERSASDANGSRDLQTSISPTPTR